MKYVWIALMALLPVFASAQVKDLGAYRNPIPITDNGDLRWLDAALFDSGFIFNEAVRDEYFDHCLRLVTPHLKFSEKTWDWLLEHPAVLNATFALEYPPNPNVIHNFIKLAKLVGPVYAAKYEQLLIAFAVKYRGKKGEPKQSYICPRRSGKFGIDMWGEQGCYYCRYCYMVAQTENESGKMYASYCCYPTQVRELCEGHPGYECPQVDVYEI